MSTLPALRRMSLVAVVAASGCVDVPDDPFADAELDVEACVASPCVFPPTGEDEWDQSDQISITEMAVLQEGPSTYTMVLGNQPNDASRNGIFVGVDLDIGEPPALRFVPTAVRPTAIYWDPSFNALAIAGKRPSNDDNGASLLFCVKNDDSFECPSPPIDIAGLRGDDVHDLVTGELNETTPMGPPDAVVVSREAAYVRNCTGGNCEEFVPLTLGPSSAGSALGERLKGIAKLPTAVTDSASGSAAGAEDLIILEREAAEDRWQRIAHVENPVLSETSYQPIAAPTPTTGSDQSGFVLLDLDDDDDLDALAFGGNEVPHGAETVDGELGDPPIEYVELIASTSWNVDQSVPTTATAAAQGDLLGAGSVSEVAFVVDDNMVVVYLALRLMDGELRASTFKEARARSAERVIDIATGPAVHFITVGEDGVLTCLELTDVDLIIDEACSSPEPVPDPGI